MAEITFGLARELTSAELGRVALLILPYQLFVGISRATTGVLLGGLPSSRFALRIRASPVLIGHVVQATVLAGLLSVTALIGFPRELQPHALLLCLTLFLLANLEFARSTAIGERALKTFAALESVGLLVATASLAVSFVVFKPSGVSSITSWVALAVMPAVVLQNLFWAAFLLRGSRKAEEQTRTHPVLDMRSLYIDWLASGLRLFAPTYILLAFWSEVEVASYRGAWTLIGLMLVAARGMISVLVPEARDRPRHELMRWGVQSVAALGVFFTVGLLVVVVLPEPMGRAFLGETWALARLPAIALSASLVIRSVEFVAASLLLGRAHYREVARLRMTVAIFELALTSVLGASIGPVGAAFGHIAGAVVAGVLLFRAFRRSLLRGQMADA